MIAALGAPGRAAVPQTAPGPTPVGSGVTWRLRGAQAKGGRSERPIVQWLWAARGGGASGQGAKAHLNGNFVNTTNKPVRQLGQFQHVDRGATQLPLSQHTTLLLPVTRRELRKRYALAPTGNTPSPHSPARPSRRQPTGRLPAHTQTLPPSGDWPWSSCPVLAPSAPWACTEPPQPSTAAAPPQPHAGAPHRVATCA